MSMDIKTVVKNKISRNIEDLKVLVSSYGGVFLDQRYDAFGELFEIKSNNDSILFTLSQRECYPVMKSFAFYLKVVELLESEGIKIIRNRRDWDSVIQEKTPGELPTAA